MFCDLQYHTLTDIDLHVPLIVHRREFITMYQIHPTFL
jgi:hypothetical protein